MPHTDPVTGALITDHEIGTLPPLLPHEHLAVTTGLAQAARGEPITPSVATQCVHALARLAGLEETMPAQGVMPERPAEQLDTPTLTTTPDGSTTMVEIAPLAERGWAEPSRTYMDAMDLDDKSSRPPRHAAPDDDEPPLELPRVVGVDLPPIDSPPTDPLPWRDGGGIY